MGRRWCAASPGSRAVRSGSSPTTASDRKSTRLNSSHSQISYAVFCLKKKKKQIQPIHELHIYPYRRQHPFHHDTHQRTTYVNTESLPITLYASPSECYSRSFSTDSV